MAKHRSETIAQIFGHALDQKGRWAERRCTRAIRALARAVEDDWARRNHRLA
jgi:hypothetical protein